MKLYLLKQFDIILIIMTINTSNKELKTLIKESVREVMKDEISKLRALAMPSVSDAEQKDIERRYGKPTRKGVKSYTLKV